MWELFKEYLWKSGWGRLVAVVNGILSIWGIVLIFDPNLSNKLPPLIRVDPRMWYGLAIAFLIFTCIWILYKSSQYRRKIESADNIRFVYNANRYKPCKEVQTREHGEIEIYRIGIRSIGSEAVESLIVFPDTLERVDDKSYQRTPISSIPLHPMTGSIGIIYRGFIPSSYVDVFQHVNGAIAIFMCYDNYKEEPIVLANGRYELILLAKGKPKTSHLGTMVITMTDGNISVEIKKKDTFGG
jgi:uncharacterized membrane protein YjgN (DUF898 family)